MYQLLTPTARQYLVFAPTKNKFFPGIVSLAKALIKLFHIIFVAVYTFEFQWAIVDCQVIKIRLTIVVLFIFV